ncbi:hypothetical protein DCE79_14905 [Lysinibacillus sp. 2017]|uniref:abortive infection family protein n=1 Tax=unclassified Lysinibacillus TaxID=2636778 RepID=UPI000D52722F|nr:MULTISPECIES: abortive infection family protein [unclassified Lysinibacillus]AWE08579.1 hypothetical protein DCE79_14905 [Lysinibacillus sp. 2017]TGN35669.1 hypothetical protein E4L99_08725 [Lysinibacillus sp. S2017]
MANLTLREIRLFEDLLGMGSGYVLDFSNNSFARFVMEAINIDIYGGPGYTEYCSKANKLRQIWQNEQDSIVGKLMEDLLDYYIDQHIAKEVEPMDKEQSLIQELNGVIKRLQGNTATINLPLRLEDTLKTLLDDIQGSLSKNKPALVLDRLHTFAVKYLRDLCAKYGIATEGPNGKKIALHGLAGKLKKQYENSGIISSKFALIAIQSNIALFDSYNEIRNEKSYAHDNPILNDIEADFVVRAMANVLTFLDKIELKIQHEKSNEIFQLDNLDMELPF